MNDAPNPVIDNAIQILDQPTPATTQVDKTPADSESIPSRAVTPARETMPLVLAPELMAQKEAEVQARRVRELTLMGANIVGRRVNTFPSMPAVPAPLDNASEAEKMQYDQYKSLQLLHLVSTSSPDSYRELIQQYPQFATGIPFQGDPIPCPLFVDGTLVQYELTGIQDVSLNEKKETVFTCTTKAGEIIKVSQPELLTATAIHERGALLAATPHNEKQSLNTYLDYKDATRRDEPVVLSEDVDTSNKEAQQTLGIVTSEAVAKRIDASKDMSPNDKSRLQALIAGKTFLNPEEVGDILLTVENVGEKKMKFQYELMQNEQQLKNVNTALQSVTGEDETAQRLKAMYTQQISDLKLKRTEIKDRIESLSSIPDTPEGMAVFVQAIYDGSTAVADPKALERSIETGNSDELIESILAAKKGTSAEQQTWKNKLLQAAKYGGIAAVIIIAVSLIAAGKEG